MHLMWIGMEFQAFRPATENALSAKRVLVLVTVTLKSPRADDLSRLSSHLLNISVSIEEPCRSSRQTLTRITCIFIRFSTGCQCSLFSSGVTCAGFGSEQISRAALFCIRSSRRRTAALQSVSITKIL